MWWHGLSTVSSLLLCSRSRELMCCLCLAMFIFVILHSAFKSASTVKTETSPRNRGPRGLAHPFGIEKIVLVSALGEGCGLRSPETKPAPSCVACPRQHRGLTDRSGVRTAWLPSAPVQARGARQEG